MKHRPTHAVLIAILVILVLGALLVVIPHAAQKVSNMQNTATSTATTATTSSSTVDPSWLTSTGSGALTFRYPAQLSTTYMHATDWPPVVAIATSTACAPKNNEMGKTESRTIAGAQYCVTTLSEGAAGSTYTTYTYATQKSGKQVSLKFTIRSVQCDNYDEPQRTQCHTERNAFSVDDLVTKIVSSIEFK